MCSNNLLMTPISRDFYMDSWLKMYTDGWSHGYLEKYLNLVQNKNIFHKTIDESFGI